MRTWAQLTASAGDNEQERQELDEAFFAAWAGTGGNDTVNSILGGGQGGGLPEQQRQDQPAADEAWDRQDFTAPELALPANWQDTNAIQLDHWQRDTQQQQQHVNGMNGVNGNSTQPQRAEPETRPTTETTTIVNGDDHHTRRMPTRSYIENPGLSFFNFSSSSSRSSSALSASSSQSPNREDGNNGRGSVQDNRRQVRATIARAAESENVQENNNGNANGVTTVDAQNVQRAQEERNNHGDVPMASAPPAITRAGLGRGRREHQPVLNGGGLQLLGREEEGEGRGGRSIYSPPRPPPLVNGFHFPSRPGPSSAAATVAATASAADAVNDRGTWNVAPVRSRVNGVAPTTNTNGHLNGSSATSTTYANGVRSNAGHEGQENNENGEAVDGGLGNGPVHNTSRTNNGDSDSDDSISRLLTFPTCWCCGATLPEVPPVCCDQCGVAN
ncbi:hypothetical protein VTN31DRAFT_6583 [Thermomyces dupontii]|uniref:uncharacterized protein n=1 Tax=Talaromyces thermophilus TaxID=28565 RepID=UPI003742D643